MRNGNTEKRWGKKMLEIMRDEKAEIRARNWVHPWNFLERWRYEEGNCRDIAKEIIVWKYQKKVMHGIEIVIAEWKIERWR